MFVHPIDGPAIIQLGPIVLPFYGAAFALSIFIFDYLGRIRVHTLNVALSEHVEKLWLYLFMGVMVGARIGDIVFYRLSYFVHNPWIFRQNQIIQYNAWISLGIMGCHYVHSQWFMKTHFPIGLFIFPLLILTTGDAGMSFHGALIGGLLAILAYSYQFKQSFLDIADFIAPLIPPGLGIGRFANFMNSELFGRPTHVPWAVIFPRVDLEPRHPSQLYECCLEGLILFFILWNFSKYSRPRGAVFGLAISLYAIIRISVEYLKDSDQVRCFPAFGYLTIGQLMSIPMLIGGVILFLRSYCIMSSKIRCNMTD